MYRRKIKKNRKRKRRDNKFNKIFKIILIITFFILNIYYYIFSSCREKKFMRELANFKTFSQVYEDLILFILLYDVKKGFYIDIGAYDPTKISVTKYFYLRGWHGINIEPQKNKIKLFEKDRPRDTNLEIAVGNYEGNVTFYIQGDGSTIQKKYSRGKLSGINIKIDTMSNICRKYVPKGIKIDFCKIDIEGGERDALLGYDFINYRPKIFCVESAVPGTEQPNYQLWEEILIKNGYTFVFSKIINRFYVDNKYPKIIKRVEYIKEYFNKMNIIKK